VFFTILDPETCRQDVEGLRQIERLQSCFGCFAERSAPNQAQKPAENAPVTAKVFILLLWSNLQQGASCRSAETAVHQKI